ncbi:putative protein TPLATE [Cocos nucifera]|nr:putative protein TPLATE [Cocos nucifera]
MCPSWSSLCEKIVTSPVSVICKKLAFNLLCSTRFTANLSNTILYDIHSDLTFPIPDIAAAILCPLHHASYLLALLVHDDHYEIAACFDSPTYFDSPTNSLRLTTANALCILTHNDIILYDASSVLLDRVSA